MLSYNVFLYDFNTKQPVPHDIMPYLIDTYNKCKSANNWWMLEDPSKVPESKNDFEHFVEETCQYRYWARCEYEWLMLNWPPGKTETVEQCVELLNKAVKIDAWEQIKINFDVVVATFMANIKTL